MDEGDIAELPAGGEGEQRVVRPAVMSGEKLEHGLILFLGGVRLHSEMERRVETVPRMPAVG